ncbi:TPA: restriction endonuclease subunit S [Vibrio vulnificus]|nr:restriction endonuclease subunit S [Vibrio vulnificus]
MSAEKLITDHIDIWTSAIQAKSASGRGSSKKRELYGIKKLRELILELAVRGKLVPQDPTDEPASVLLERIAAEKAQLVKEGKIKKQKSLLAVGKDEVAFDIPLGWQIQRLPDVYFSISPSAKKLKSSELLEEGLYPVVDQGQEYIAGYSNDLERVICLKCPVVVFGDHTRNIKYIDFNFVPGADGTKILCPIVLDPKYFYVHLTSYDLESRGYGRHFKILNDNLIAIPPLNEQHRIVAKVDELMALCDQLEQQTEASLDAHQVLVETLLATLTNSQNAHELMANWARISEHFDTLFTTEQSIDQLKQTILQLAVMGKLVAQNPNDEPAAKLLERIAEEKAQLVKEKKIKKQKALPPIAEDEKPFELPDGWEWCRFEHIAKNEANALKAGPFGSALKKSMYVDHGFKIYGQEQVISGDENIGDYFVNEEKYLSLESCKVQEGDILISLVGTIGKVLILSGNAQAGIINPRLVKISLFDDICRHYIRIVLGSKLIQDELFESSHGSTMNVLNLGLLKKIMLPLPPVAEQLEIVMKVNTLGCLCDQLKQRLRDSQQTQLHLTDAIVEQAL